MSDKRDISVSRAKRILKALLLFFLPFAIAALFILALYAIFSWPQFIVIGGGIMGYFFPPLGKESIIPIMVNGLVKLHGFSAFNAIVTSGLAIAFVDMVVGLFLMWNFDLVLKVPFFGPIIRKMETKGGEYLKEKTWLRKLAFIGVALFVMFPFQGSGGVGGTIMGRLLGMPKRKVWYAVVTGGVVGCFMIATIS
ncbi:MAG: small multi-drug export protein, partial [Thermoplasmata archaeon]|nr:small multi-drug export protein [Thermoplasmata archaeon]